MRVRKKERGNALHWFDRTYIHNPVIPSRREIKRETEAERDRSRQRERERKRGGMHSTGLTERIYIIQLYHPGER